MGFREETLGLSEGAPAQAIFGVVAVGMPLRLSNAARCSHIHSHHIRQFFAF
jgi:hypothetical protein